MGVGGWMSKKTHFRVGHQQESTWGRSDLGQLEQNGTGVRTTKFL